MTKDKQLSDTWLKAAVLGCLWASSEIVLGSFLHNLRVPFSSSFLTGIGIMLLVSVSYLWNNKGLFWRSGLICALMKSVSPSAIIFGPMIAIFCEALLLELSIFLFRRNIFAFIIGGMLAMSWTFIQKIASFIIVYGFNMVNLYKDITKFAQKQLSIHFENIWTPVLALWLIYLAFGAVAAIFGIYIGKKALKKSPEINANEITSKITKKIKSRELSRKTSLVWLIIDSCVMVLVLCLMNFTGWEWWITGSIAVILVWALRYNKALRPLKKPKFWIIFVIITMLTSYLFNEFQSDSNDFLSGLLIGLQMNLRAAVMIIGFSVIGTELANPVIRNFFAKTSFRQLPMAMEVAFDTLPFVIANFPEFKNILKKPVSVVQQIVLQADLWLDRVMIKLKNKDNVIIISGNIGQGKTTLLKEITGFLKANGIKAGGIISPAVIQDGKRIGYDLINIDSGEKKIISRIHGTNHMTKAGKYFFRNDGLEFGYEALSPEANNHNQIVIIDEIGFLELENAGWSTSLTNLFKNSDLPVILVVRSELVEKVIDKWIITEPLMIKSGTCSPKDAAIKILDFLKITV